MRRVMREAGPRMFPVSYTHLDVYKRQVYLLEQDIDSRPANGGWLKSYRDLNAVFVPHMRNEEEHIFPEAVRLMPEKQLEEMACSEFFPAF